MYSNPGSRSTCENTTFSLCVAPKYARPPDKFSTAPANDMASICNSPALHHAIEALFQSTKIAFASGVDCTERKVNFFHNFQMFITFFLNLIGLTSAHTKSPKQSPGEWNSIHSPGLGKTIVVEKQALFEKAYHLWQCQLSMPAFYLRIQTVENPVCAHMNSIQVFRHLNVIANVLVRI